MSDEQGIPQGDSPEDAGSINWEQRYKDTQAEYTRQQQRLKDLESTLEDEDALWNVASEKFGWNAADDEPEDAGVGEDDFFEGDEPPAQDPRVEQLMQKIAEIESGVTPLQAAHAEQQYEKDLQKFTGDRYGALSDWDRQIIESLNVRFGNNEKALKQAVELWGQHNPAEEPEAGKKSKPSAVVPGGRAVTEQVDFSSMSDNDRQKAMMDLYRARMAQ